MFVMATTKEKTCPMLVRLYLASCHFDISKHHKCCYSCTINNSNKNNKNRVIVWSTEYGAQSRGPTYAYNSHLAHPGGPRCVWRMSFISTPGHAPSHLSSWAGLSAGNFQVATECSSSCPETETEAPGEMDPRIVRQLRGKVMRHVCVLKEVLLLLWHLKEN